MGYSSETITPSSRARAFAPSNTPMWRGANKNGLVRYFLNNKQVTETQYKETFADTIQNDGSLYTGDMPAYTTENGLTRGGQQYSWKKNQDRHVEVYIPIGYFKMESQTIYPFCLAASKTDMYSDLGWNVEETWRGYKHWDRLQTGIKFRGEYDVNTHYKYNDIVIYSKKKRRPDGSGSEFQPLSPTGMYRCLRDSLGRPPHYGPQEPTRSPLMTKSTTTSGKLIKEQYQEYPAHIQSYWNDNPYAGTDNLIYNYYGDQYVLGSDYAVAGQVVVSETTAVPEPGTLILTGSALLAGAIGVYFTRRHRDQALTPTAV